eukprot:CFRG5703T1
MDKVGTFCHFGNQRLLACLILVSLIQFGMPASTRIFSRYYFNSVEDFHQADTLTLFNALKGGCFGVLRDGRDCSSSKHANMRVVEDPTKNDKYHSHVHVLEVKYKGGEFGAKPGTGAQFYTQHLKEANKNSDRGSLEYQVYFPSGFDFQQGGKLPGLHGGNLRCSGLRAANGVDCFSTRMMWRADGAGEAYMYVPIEDQAEEFCRSCVNIKERTCSSDHETCSLQRGSFYFKTGRWTSIRQYVQLNTPGKRNGIFRLYVDGALTIEKTQVFYRSTNSLTVDGLVFSTFFGGGSQRFAPEKDQVAFFKGFSLYSGEQ